MSRDRGRSARPNGRCERDRDATIRCYTAAVPFPSERGRAYGPSELSERFDLRRRVARGAFGEVYRGLDRATGQEVAIKRLHTHLSDAASLERFEREARILSSTESPYLVRYLAHGLDAEARHCLV